MSIQGKLTPITNPNKDSSGVNQPQCLDDIKQQIASYQNNIEKSYLKIGQLLLDTKKLFGKHGEWLKWLQDNVDFSVCKAERLMKIARWSDENTAPVPDLTFTQAYILCKLTQKELNEFGEFIKGLENVKGMRKRELEAVIRNFLKSKNEKPSTDQSSQQAESPISTKNDILERFDQVKSEVSKLANLIDDASDEYDTCAADLCDLCQSIIQQLSPEDVENI